MSKTVEKLNLYLANLNVLYRKVQNYHWNIVGTGFFSVHAKLEEYYDALNEQIKEAENKEISIADAVADVKKEFEAMLKLVKEVKETADSENDYGTSAMVDEYISTYEKDLWMLNAYLK